jgi:sulfite reductase alpha subunit-like flavoprotein
MKVSKKLKLASKAELNEQGQLLADNLALANILNTTAQTLQAELTDETVNFWKFLLKDYSILDVRAAFFDYVQTEKYFPKPIDILYSLDRIRTKKDKAYNEATREADRRMEQAARERGELFGWPDVLRQFKELLDKKQMEPKK